MKKSKLILIPALSVASVGAVVAPLATSCSTTSSATNTFTFVKDSKVQEYKAQVTAKVKGDTFKKASDSAMTSDATVAYWKDVEANPLILFDDICVFINKIASELTGYVNYSLGISNTKINYMRYQGKDVPLASFTISVNVEYKKSSNADETIKENATFEVSNAMSGLIFSQGKTPALAFAMRQALVYHCMTNAALNFKYNYIEADGTKATDVDITLNSSNAEEITQFLSMVESETDPVIALIVRILFTGSEMNMTSSYFANQVEATE